MESFDEFCGKMARTATDYDELSMHRADDLVTLIRAGFYTSLEQEEGRPCRFALALLKEEELTTSEPRSWRPIMFEEPLPLTVPVLAKVAPGADPSRVLVAVTSSEGSLWVRGLVRTSGALNPVFTVVAENTGVVSIKTGPTTYLGRFSKGTQRALGIPLSMTRSFGNAFRSWSERNGVPTWISQRWLRLTLTKLRGHATGGTLLFVPQGQTTDDLAFRYRLRSSDLVLDGMRAATEDEAAKPKKRLKLSLHRPPSGDSVLFDCASLSADLATIDGAFVMDTEFRVQGFGAKIHTQRDDDVAFWTGPTRKSKGLPGNPLIGLGTRHQSAARFVSAHLGSGALVVSQDASITCMHSTQLNSSGEWVVVVWRPVALQPWGEPLE